MRPLVWKKSNAFWFQLSALGPAIVVFVFVYFVTIILLIGTSFSEWQGIRVSGFAGTANYVRMFTDSVEAPIFFRGLLNNLTWSIIAVGVHLPLAIIAALILHRQPRGWRLFRTVFFVPHLISIAAFAIIFKQVFNPSIGLMAGLFTSLGLTAIAQINWFFDPVWAWPVIISTWLFHIGFFMVIYLAELSSMPQELFESARVEGATPFQQVRYITLPLLRNTIGTTAILTVTGGLKYFEGIFLMTNGGPSYRTVTLSVYLYQKMQLLQNGYSSAVGTALLFVGILVIIVFSRLFRLGESAYY